MPSGHWRGGHTRSAASVGGTSLDPRLSALLTPTACPPHSPGDRIPQGGWLPGWPLSPPPSVLHSLLNILLYFLFLCPIAADGRADGSAHPVRWSGGSSSLLLVAL
eukprot:TRINITY_DN5796_c0_g1_i1.p2 TRINITY_DN5796_c0_g1~~TRINITY_DN5796_c0_g1_i1.p2  ORF type:complete len:106 (+),score=0.37 TRINITY_DN5796_c0_g1_i1:313-630(+)